MAIIWMDGFDVNGNNIRQQNYDIFNGISTSDFNNGRYDGYSILMNDYTSTEINRFSLGAHKTIPNVTEITAGVAVLRQQSGSFPGMMINDTAPMLTFYNESPIYANFIVGCSISGGSFDPVTAG